MDRYPSLKYAIIVNTYQSASRKFTASPINPTIALFHTAHAAANHIFTLLQMTHHPDSVEAHFAISGGVPVFPTMSHLRPGLSPNTNIYGSAIVPTVAIPFTHISPETNATIAWARLGAVNDRFHCCTLPPTYTAYGEEPEAEDFVHAAAKKILLDHTNACYQQPYIQQHLRDLSAFNMLLTSVEPVLPESVANVNPASSIRCSRGLSAKQMRLSYSRFMASALLFSLKKGPWARSTIRISMRKATKRMIGSSA